MKTSYIIITVKNQCVLLSWFASQPQAVQMLRQPHKLLQLSLCSSTPYLKKTPNNIPSINALSSNQASSKDTKLISFQTYKPLFVYSAPLLLCFLHHRLSPTMAFGSTRLLWSCCKGRGLAPPLPPGPRVLQNTHKTLQPEQCK